LLGVGRVLVCAAVGFGRLSPERTQHHDITTRPLRHPLQCGALHLGVSFLSMSRFDTAPLALQNAWKRE